MTKREGSMTNDQCKADLGSIQAKQRKLLRDQQMRGIPLIQRRSDGVWVRRSHDGREMELSYSDRDEE
ncbi:hypothetical protein J3R80_11470 [Aliiroseovarius sp. Z3]|uniref:hypothetical protein n=1 Tax=Aliiroseovarius sp. Z3 TaxID=2811402 RepID=UPI0023B2EA1F|nr:hypothetical protein [Aliiroseovarius sp. Z3]MDE9451082.1 hypothetical protein [Aliiroseovarius sp. Z3]